MSSDTNRRKESAGARRTIGGENSLPPEIPEGGAIGLAGVLLGVAGTEAYEGAGKSGASVCDLAQTYTGTGKRFATSSS